MIINRVLETLSPTHRKAVLNDIRFKSALMGDDQEPFDTLSLIIKTILNNWAHKGHMIRMTESNSVNQIKPVTKNDLSQLTQQIRQLSQRTSNERSYVPLNTPSRQGYERSSRSDKWQKAFKPRQTHFGNFNKFNSRPTQTIPVAFLITANLIMGLDPVMEMGLMETGLDLVMETDSITLWGFEMGMDLTITSGCRMDKGRIAPLRHKMRANTLITTPTKMNSLS